MSVVIPENRTNVRTISTPPHLGPRPPLWLRLGFRVAGALAPPLAARAAEEIFLRPPRPPPRPAPILERGHRFFLPVDGLELAVRSWGDGPTVLLQHGWGGRSDHLAAFVEPLLAAGFSVVAPDAPAHGDSEGTHSNLVQFARSIAAVAKRVQGLHGLVAHSMGAAASALAIHGGLPVRRAVFIASPASLSDRVHDFARAFDISPWVAQDLRARVERRVGFDMADLDIARVGRSMTTPLLVFHDPADREVPWRDGATIAQAWPGARLLDVPGAGHHRILKTQSVIEGSVAFLRSGGASLL